MSKLNIIKIILWEQMHKVGVVSTTWFLNTHLRQNDGYCILIKILVKAKQ